MFNIHHVKYHNDDLLKLKKGVGAEHASVKSDVQRVSQVINMNNTDIAVKQPLVSIIIATYQRGEPFERALRSAVAQSYPNIEIIVADDNPDVDFQQKNAEIIKSISSTADAKIIHLKNKENIGSARTRNEGIKAASGKYITFLDDDDIYLTDKVLHQVEFMIEHELDYCLTNIELYNENDQLVGKRDRSDITDNSVNGLMSYHLTHNLTATDTMMFRADYLRKIGGFPEIDSGDEFYLMSEAIQAGGKFRLLPLFEVKAYVHSETDGLSSGDVKINGENQLFEYKKKFFHILDRKARNKIIVRHYAVIAFAEYRRKKYFAFLKNGIIAFFRSPVACLQILIAFKNKVII